MSIGEQEANRLRVLKAIRRAEPVSRIELVERAGLPSQAISELVAELLCRDLLREEKMPPAGRGRPRIQLRLNPRAAYVVGAFLSPDRSLGIDIANLRGDQLFERSFRLRHLKSLEAVAERIASNLEETISAGPLAKSAIHSVGLGLPAVVDGLRGVVHWMPGYLPRPVPFAALIEERLGLPVFLDSAADILARAEHWFGDDHQVDDFTLILVGLGIGLGQYEDGLLRIGQHGMSPAFAHVKVPPGHGPLCVCGAQGCLMTYASMSGVVGRLSHLRGLPTPHLEQMLEVFHAFAREACAGDVRSLEIFDFAGHALGLAVANYINIWDPLRLVVIIEDAVFADMIAASFRASVTANTLPALRDRASVQIRASEKLAFSKGAAALVLERLYRGSGAATGGRTGVSAPLTR